jgi:hypothetical protein
MLTKIHAAVENANDLDPSGRRSIEENVGTHRIFAVSGSYVITRPTLAGVFRNGLNRDLENTSVSYGLLLAPTRFCVVPDFVEVPLGSRRESVATHVAAFSFRLFL